MRSKHQLARLAHAFEPPVGPFEPASPSGGRAAGRSGWEAELELVTEGGFGLAVGFYRRIHSFSFYCDRGGWTTAVQ